MAPSRGTDRATEERRVQPRRDDDDAIGRWLKALFDALGEVSVVCLPSLVLALYAARPVTKFVAAVVLAAFVSGVAAGRLGRISVGPPWPRLTPLLVVLRVGYYNVAFWGAVTLGIAVAPGIGLGTEWSSVDVGGASLVAVLVVGVAVVAFPTAARATERLAASR